MSVLLTIEQQLVWEAWIVEIENTILVNMSLTNDEKVVLISLSMKAFFSINIDIYNKLSYEKIDNWGFVVDFLYVDISINIEITQSVVIDGNGKCKVCDALKEESDNCDCDAQEKADLDSLIVEIEVTLQMTSYTYEQKMGKISKLVKEFFRKHPNKEKKLKSKHIEGYGSFESFLRVCKTYEQITTMSVVISGYTSDDCELLAALEDALTNSSFSLPQKAEINELKKKIEAYFKNTTDYNLRLQFVSYSCYQQFKLAPWMRKIVEQISVAEWGNIYEIIFCSGICSNKGCGDVNDGPGPAANCAAVGSLIVVDGMNKTLLTDTLTVSYSSFTPSQKLGFNSCFNKIRKAIWDNVLFPNEKAKLKEVQADFWSYNNNSVTNQQLVFNITIQKWKGSVAQLVKCIN